MPHALLKVELDRDLSLMSLFVDDGRHVLYNVSTSQL